MLKILVAEDNRAERLLLQAILESAGHKVTLAENSKQALSAYKHDAPDMVLLDVLLGHDSGRDIALAMRAMQKDIFIPVVFITGLSMPEDIVECLKVGDDVIQKPIKEEIILSKISALRRIKDLYGKIKDQRDEISKHRNLILREQDFAKKIYDRIAHAGILESPYIQFYVSPQAFFNGDVVLATYHPLGGLLLFLGDFTGHGLPAALGALPLSDIFYSMSKRGYSMMQILRKMNQKLKDILPSEIFCAASLIYVDEKEGVLQAWNGGLPPGRIRYADGKDDKFIKSSHVPLGILPDEKFNPEPEYLEIKAGDHIFLFSDGVYEAYGSDEMADAHRLVNQVFENQMSVDKIYNGIIQAISQMKGENQRDDITLVDITVAPFIELQNEAVEYLKQNKDSIDWRLSLTLGPNSLRFFDPMPILLQVINEVPPLRMHGSRIYTIVSEMFSNALEHGLLKLNSALKHSVTGFHDYYEKRKNALFELKEGEIQLEISFFDKKDERFLRIMMRDSGPGFVEKPPSTESQAFCGRGIPLLRSLCDSVTFSENGTVCEALYRWR